MKAKKTGKEGFLVMKLDMSKAFDRVEWFFLEQLSLKMGIYEKWVGMVMEIVKTVSYSILINGEPQGNFQPTREFDRGILYPPIFS